MRVFKSRWFKRFARKEGISDAILREAVTRAERFVAQLQADLAEAARCQAIAAAIVGELVATPRL